MTLVDDETTQVVEEKKALAGESDELVRTWSSVAEEGEEEMKLDSRSSPYFMLAEALRTPPYVGECERLTPRQHYLPDTTTPLQFMTQLDRDVFDKLPINNYQRELLLRELYDSNMLIQ